MADTTDKPRTSETTDTAQRPRDAATLIIVDDAGDRPKILMGKRRTDQVFMPGKFVFPGGRVDVTDKDVVSADELAGDEIQKLLYDMKVTVPTSRGQA